MHPEIEKQIAVCFPTMARISTFSVVHFEADHTVHQKPTGKLGNIFMDSKRASYLHADPLRSFVQR